MKEFLKDVPEKEITFIPTASNTEDYKGYVDEAKQAFLELGFSINILDISKTEKQKIENLKSKWNLDLDFNAKIKNLSADKRFYTAMFSALYTNPQFLILDEPASVFTDKERQTFFSVLKKTCTEEKIGVILITHKVEEALNFADRISVLKNGKMQGSFLTEDLGTDDEAELFIKKQMVKFIIKYRIMRLSRK